MASTMRLDDIYIQRTCSSTRSQVPGRGSVWPCEPHLCPSTTKDTEPRPVVILSFESAHNFETPRPLRGQHALQLLRLESLSYEIDLARLGPLLSLTLKAWFRVIRCCHVNMFETCFTQKDDSLHGTAGSLGLNWWFVQLRDDLWIFSVSCNRVHNTGLLRKNPKGHEFYNNDKTRTTTMHGQDHKHTQSTIYAEKWPEFFRGL